MKQKKAMKELEARGFKITQKVGGGNYSTENLYVDETKSLWCYHNFRDKTVEVYKFSDILDIDNQHQMETKTKGGIGKTLVGGFLLGPVGAIAGHAATTKKTKTRINKSILTVTIKSLTRPTIVIEAPLRVKKMRAMFTAMRGMQ